MSRSYREPVFVNSYGCRSKKYDKRRANRAVRHAETVQKGKWYRKLYDPWNIVDYRTRWNPWPKVRMNWWTHQLELFEPEPEWKARRK